MSANLEWSVLQAITSPYATLLLNEPLPLSGRDYGFLYLVKPDGYQVSPGKFRPTVDSISQADGSSIQPAYIDGLVATLTVSFWLQKRGVDGEREPACGEDLRLMNEQLMGVVNSLRSYSTDPAADQRYLWTPTGYGDQRMLTDVILAAWPAPTIDVPEVSVTFALASPFPYAIDATETSTPIAAGGTAVVSNAGNASQSPVIRVHGPSTEFVVENLDTGQLVSYSDASDPGSLNIPAGHYVELDFFRGSATLSGGAGTDVIAGLDLGATDFFLLAPGSQTLSLSAGGTGGADVLHQAAWV